MAHVDPSFVNTRARFQRLRDLKFFYGWVVALDADRLTLRCSAEDDIEESQLYVFELVNPKGSTTLAGVLKPSGKVVIPPTLSDSIAVLADREVTFAIVRQLKSSREMKSCRKATQLMTAVLSRKAGELTVTVCDVSVGGVGILTPKKLIVGEAVNFSITINGRTQTFEGEVRYCQKDRHSASLFRVGIQLSELNRLDTAIWTQLLEAA